MSESCPKCSTSLSQDGTCPRCSAANAPTEPLPASDIQSVDFRDAFGDGAYSFGLDIGDQTESTVSPRTGLWGANRVEEGQILGDFQILGTIGHGGMGIVFKAKQQSLNRIVALKVLAAFTRPGHSAVSRFRKEAHAAARLHHTNIVAIHAHGEHDGHYYYAMELIDGTSLDQALHTNLQLQFDQEKKREHDVAAVPRSLDDYRRFARLIADVADGLEYAHQAGVIHRDIKPQNILLGREQRLHITDFGLAHLQDEPHLTLSGEVMGTPAYMSPEQIRLGIGGVDWRTDIYSLGVTLYEILTLKRPFVAESRDQLIDAICTREPASPRSLDRRIPLDLETICQKAMDKERLTRYQSAGDMAEDLRRFADGRPILSRRTSRIVKAGKWMKRHKALTSAIFATVLVVILAGGLIHMRHRHRIEQANLLQKKAYEKLAYINLREPGPDVKKAMATARSQGADSTLTLLTDGLAHSYSDSEKAIQALQEYIGQESDPQKCREALCVLAHTFNIHGDNTASANAIRNAEAYGDPTTPTGWFFYGLAIHSNRPIEAMECYRRANRLRINDMYPQALLHLARAQNQFMYINRDLSEFTDATGNLRQLVRAEMYKAYPYYLLSIAYRLAAEVDQVSDNPLDRQRAESRLQEALKWARDGQDPDIDPEDDRPITAEAEALETAGRYEEAIEARNRAMTISRRNKNSLNVWEGYHYRWRLYYWLDRHRDALSDLDALETFDSNSPFYSTIYRALVLEAAGDHERAITLTRSLAGNPPEDAMNVIWEATLLRLLDASGEADHLLSIHAPTVRYNTGADDFQTATWLRELYSLVSGQRSVDEVDAMSDSATVSRRRNGEKFFHAAVLELSRNNRDQAIQLLERARQTFDGENRYTFHAKVLSVKLNQDHPVE